MMRQFVSRSRYSAECMYTHICIVLQTAHFNQVCFHFERGYRHRPRIADSMHAVDAGKSQILIMKKKNFVLFLIHCKLFDKAANGLMNLPFSFIFYYRVSIRRRTKSLCKINKKSVVFFSSFVYTFLYRIFI